MSVHSLLPKKAEIIISRASNVGSIGLDDISELSQHIADYFKTADSRGRKIVSYVFWRVLLGYQTKYDGVPMTVEESTHLVRALQPTGKLLNYLQGNIDLESDEVVKLTEAIIDLR